MERAVVRVVLLPELRPEEAKAARWLALKLLARVGAPGVVVGIVLDLLAKYAGA